MTVYEDGPTREAAVKFCDALVNQLWADSRFEVSWYSLEDLAEEQAINEAAAKATMADLVVFSFLPTGDVPIEIKAWAARWVESRGEREGAIVGLGDPAGSGGTPSPKFVWLRRLAHEARLDYLTKAPPGMTLPFPEAPESYSDRATQSSSVLDEILSRRSPPHVV